MTVLHRRAGPGRSPSARFLQDLVGHRQVGHRPPQPRVPDQRNSLIAFRSFGLVSPLSPSRSRRSGVGDGRVRPPQPPPRGCRRPRAGRVPGEGLLLGGSNPRQRNTRRHARHREKGSRHSSATPPDNSKTQPNPSPHSKEGVGGSSPPEGFGHLQGFRVCAVLRLRIWLTES